jgi:hypothetical protein
MTVSVTVSLGEHAESRGGTSMKTIRRIRFMGTSKPVLNEVRDGLLDPGLLQFKIVDDGCER